jgi:MraZ protein
MYLTGAKQHRLDAKARLTLPAEFRKDFQDKVLLIPMSETLYGFTPESHREWMTSVFPDGINPRDKAQQQLARILNSSTVTLDIDSAGRIALGKVPQKVRDKFQLTDEITIVGNGDHFELWNTQVWDAQQEEFGAENLEALMYL